MMLRTNRKAWPAASLQGGAPVPSSRAGPRGPAARGDGQICYLATCPSRLPPPEESSPLSPRQRLLCAAQIDQQEAGPSHHCTRCNTRTPPQGVGLRAPGSGVRGPGDPGVRGSGVRGQGDPGASMRPLNRGAANSSVHSGDAGAGW